MIFMGRNRSSLLAAISNTILKVSILFGSIETFAVQTIKIIGY